MTEFIIRRLLQSIIVLLVASLISFVGIYMIGNPVDMLIDEMATHAERQEAIRALGLDQPFWVQYWQFLEALLRFDFGRSFVASIPASSLIFERLPATIELTAVAFIISQIGVPLGVIAGLRPHSFVSKLIVTGSIFGFSVPMFWIGLMLIMLFAVSLGWLPSTGRGETVELLGVRWALTWDGLAHLILPAVTLALFNLALLIRLARAGMRENLLMDYVRFSRAKGLRESRIVWVHALKNALIPIVTIQGLELANLLTGSIIVEVIFAYPGIGRLAIESINYLDRPVVVAYIIFVVFIFTSINLIVDILYAFIDPRIRLAGSDDG